MLCTALNHIIAFLYVKRNFQWRPLAFPNDLDALNKIQAIKLEMDYVIGLAEEQHESHRLHEAKSLYEQAQHLSFYVGTGLKCKIINEHCDLENWHQ